MKRVMLISIAFLTQMGSPFDLFSAPGDMEKAGIVARNVMGKSRSNSKTVSDVVIEKWEEQASIYVVNFREGGWVMVSADDAAIPVIEALKNEITKNHE